MEILKNKLQLSVKFDLFRSPHSSEIPEQWDGMLVFINKLPVSFADRGLDSWKKETGYCVFVQRFAWSMYNSCISKLCLYSWENLKFYYYSTWGCNFRVFFSFVTTLLGPKNFSILVRQERVQELREKVGMKLRAQIFCQSWIHVIV